MKMQTWFVFGLYDDSWWPLWEDERHRAKNPYSLLKRIRKRLLDNGEAQYEEIAAVPCGAFWGLSVASNPASGRVASGDAVVASSVRARPEEHNQDTRDSDA